MRPRALALRALGLGDLLAGVPALRALRRALPDHRLVLAAPALLRPLVDLAGPVDELLDTGELCPVPWSGPPPEVAVDLHGNGPASRDLLRALRPGRLVGFAGPGGSPPGAAWDPEEHERARWCRLVADAFGVGADPDDVRLAVPDLAPPVTGAAIVHPGAASGARRWPEERYAAVARALAAAGERVLLTGSGPEAAAVERVRTAARLPASAVAGPTDLTDLAALVAHARLVVCGDTGVAHLASAYAVPSVLLFGPTPPHRWGPPPGPHEVLWHGCGAGDPHAAEPDPALLRISVGEVLAATSRRLAAAPVAPPPAARRSTAPSA